MKNIMMVMLYLGVYMAANSQDRVLKSNGDSLLVEIREINTEEIVFNYPGENLINKLSLSEINKIIYASGREQTFHSSSNYETYGLGLEEPEYIGEVYFIRNASETVLLEKQKASIRSGFSASTYLTGIGKKRVKSIVEGPSSPVKIQPGEKLEFIIKVPDQEYNPQDEINIFQLYEKRGRRFVEVASEATWGEAKASDIDFFDFEAKPYGESSFLLQVKALPPGEYAITLKASRDNFNMFSINEI